MAGKPFRHKLSMDVKQTKRFGCNCGARWETVAEGLEHQKLARRWRYVGVQVFYDEPYYMWEHALTGHHYAWLRMRYQENVLK